MPRFADYIARENPYADGLRLGTVIELPQNGKSVRQAIERFYLAPCGVHENYRECNFDSDGERKGTHRGKYYNQTWLKAEECPHCKRLGFTWAYGYRLGGDVVGLVCPDCTCLWQLYDRITSQGAKA